MSAGDLLGLLIVLLIVLLIGSAGLVAIFFYHFYIKSCLEKQKKFNGVALAVWCAFFSGLILILSSYYQTFEKQLEKIKNKKYQKYAQQEIDKFMAYYVPLRIAVAVFIIIGGLVAGGTTS